MKTAISLPDELFDRAEEYASQHGLSRSELFAKALREFLDLRRQDGLTAQIDRVCEEEDTRLPRDIAEHNRRRLLDGEW